MSSTSTITLKPSEAAFAIDAMLDVNLVVAAQGKDRRGLFLWGAPGTAKSSVVKQTAKKRNFKVIDIRLTQMDPTDLRGIPVPSGLGTDHVEVHWAIPAMLPKRAPGSRIAMLEKDVWEIDETIEGKTSFGEKRSHFWDGAIILLDELPNAAPSVQAGSYQLVLDGQLGEYYVPDNVFVMAAGNRETDKGSTFRMPTPLMNRFVHVEVRSDFNDWQDYALMMKFNEDVVGYLTNFKSHLYNFDPKSSSRNFATGRSWEAVSDLLNNSSNLPDTVLYALVAGAIGDGIAVQFMDFRKNASKLPSASDILDGKVTTLDIKDTSLCYTLSVSLCYELKDRYQHYLDNKTAENKKKFDGYCNNFFKYMMSEFKQEMTVMGARTALSKFKIKIAPSGIECWKEFAAKYNSLILG